MPHKTSTTRAARKVAAKSRVTPTAASTTSTITLIAIHGALARITALETRLAAVEGRIAALQPGSQIVRELRGRWTRPEGILPDPTPWPGPSREPGRPPEVTCDLPGNWASKAWVAR